MPDAVVKALYEDYETKKAVVVIEFSPGDLDGVLSLRSINSPGGLRVLAAAIEVAADREEGYRKGSDLSSHRPGCRCAEHDRLFEEARNDRART